ncbi:hypothetical protein SOVF_077660 [Spinacia oleracea]|uniref:Uncharacterized protein n=1 Tax=Spinacia oleracea TaxID=3562 RepID=A0A9R0JXV8_SPIOL|nr:uncharacterized protein LOC110790143 [Spinacia oleracea]KNA17687.1 hypothetical protein SOVF_077660 [Spinacia oleracea]
MSNEERVIIEDDAESPSNPFIHRHRCCFQLPCFGSSPTSTTPRHITLGGGGANSSLSDPSTSFWDRFRSAENEPRWWSQPFKAFKKIREWSEIVAGPKWKTFIRRINRRRPNHRHHHHQQQQSTGQFQYDPLSYALNFDEGPGQNGHFDEDYDAGNFPDFSSRFASAATPPPSSKSPAELGNGAPAC